MRSRAVSAPLSREREIGDRGVAVALLRHGAEPRAPLGRRRAGRLGGRRADRLRVGASASPLSASMQFVLPVAGDAGDAEDLAGAHARS